MNFIDIIRDGNGNIPDICPYPDILAYASKIALKNKEDKYTKIYDYTVHYEEGDQGITQFNVLQDSDGNNLDETDVFVIIASPKYSSVSSKTVSVQYFDKDHTNQSSATRVGGYINLGSALSSSYNTFCVYRFTNIDKFVTEVEATVNNENYASDGKVYRTYDFSQPKNIARLHFSFATALQENARVIIYSRRS